MTERRITCRRWKAVCCVLCEELKHGITLTKERHFKVETIGDAYMAVTNLVEEQVLSLLAVLVQKYKY